MCDYGDEPCVCSTETFSSSLLPRRLTDAVCAVFVAPVMPIVLAVVWGVDDFTSACHVAKCWWRSLTGRE